METFCDRLKIEYDQLCDRIKKLERFLETDKFEELGLVQKSLLKIQLRAMCTYRQCLYERLLDLEGK